MKITPVRSDVVYKKIMTAPADKKNDIYRYELMLPFEKKWACYNIPMKAAVKNGYDVIMASGMLGHLAPVKVDSSQEENIKSLSSDTLWKECQKSIQKSLDRFSEHGIDPPVKEYLYTLVLAEPEHPSVKLSKGYYGDGGIPGYIFAALVPTDYTLNRLPACLAHETNHNVCFQFIRWSNDITLGEMMVSEGLAENFAARLYGEDLIGPWVSETDIQTLNEYIKPIIREGLGAQGMANLTAYLYGDEIAALQNYSPVGLPYCAGYACGYYLIKHYLNKTGKSVVEATTLPADEILNMADDFWNER